MRKVCRYACNFNEIYIFRTSTKFEPLVFKTPCLQKEKLNPPLFNTSKNAMKASRTSINPFTEWNAYYM